MSDDLELYLDEQGLGERRIRELDQSEKRLAARALYHKRKAKEAERRKRAGKGRGLLVPLTPEHMYLGFRFASFRKLKGLTLQGAANRAGYSKNRYRELEAGSAPVLFEDILRIANALQIPPYAFLVGVEEMDLMRPSFPVARIPSPGRARDRVVLHDHDDVDESGMRAFRPMRTLSDTETWPLYDERGNELPAPIEQFYDENGYLALEAGFLPNAAEEFEAMERQDIKNSVLTPGKRRRKTVEQKLVETSIYPSISDKMRAMERMADERAAFREERAAKMRYSEEE